MITKERLKQFISWYQSVAGCVSLHELMWFVDSVEEYLDLDIAVTQEESLKNEGDTFKTLTALDEKIHEIFLQEMQHRIEKLGKEVPPFSYTNHLKKIADQIAKLEGVKHPSQDARPNYPFGGLLPPEPCPNKKCVLMQGHEWECIEEDEQLRAFAKLSAKERAKCWPTKEEQMPMCHCGINPATESHPCPYQQDVNNDDAFECTCCEDCTHECAMDI